MGMVLGIVGGLLGLVAFVCFIMVVVKIFQDGQTGLGIATVVTLFCCGIGYIIALVVGWQNADKWGIRNVMMIFSICLAAAIVCNVLAQFMGFTLIQLPQP